MLSALLGWLFWEAMQWRFAKVTREQESLYVLNSQMETWTRRLSAADLREEEIGELKTIHLQGFGHVLPARRQQLELGNHAGL